MAGRTPLYNLLSSGIGTLKSLNFASILDLTVHAPQYYAAWFLNLWQEAPQHVFIETILIGFIVWLVFLRPTIDPKKTSKNDKLSEKEVQDLIEDWEPQPLVPNLSEKAEELLKNVSVIEAVEGSYVRIRGVSELVLNLGSFDFFGLSNAEEIKRISAEALDKYGVGSCGPRGFYGTIDKHLELEHAIAEFMGTEEAILYSDGAATVSSAIPAFSKKGDLLLIDDACSEPILTGANLSRSSVRYFKHNDMDDLESILKSISSDDKRLKRDATQQRRFIVVEGLYRNTGELCPLKRLLDLKNKFFYRLILDESLSFGSVGATGRGVTEHFGIPITEVEIITIAADAALGTVGGLCIGNREIVDHQRLSGAGYCFSASAPPFLSAAATQSLALLASPAAGLPNKLASNSRILREKLRRVPHVTVLGVDDTPVIHAVLTEPGDDVDHEKLLIQRIAKACVEKGIGLVASKFPLVTTMKHAKNLRPSLRICVTSNLTPAELDKTVRVLAETVQLHLTRA